MGDEKSTDGKNKGNTKNITVITVVLGFISAIMIVVTVCLGLICITDNVGHQVIQTTSIDSSLFVVFAVVSGILTVAEIVCIVFTIKIRKVNKN